MAAMLGGADCPVLALKFIKLPFFESFRDQHEMTSLEIAAGVFDF